MGLTGSNLQCGEYKLTAAHILVTGDREWADTLSIYKLISKHSNPDTLIINGAARGADKLSTSAAITLSLKYKEYPADWKKYGKAAGPIRNRLMLEEGKPDLVLAFHPHLYTESKGTLDMVTVALAAGVKVILFDGKTETALN